MDDAVACGSPLNDRDRRRFTHLVSLPRPPKDGRIVLPMLAEMYYHATVLTVCAFREARSMMITNRCAGLLALVVALGSCPVMLAEAARSADVALLQKAQVGTDGSA